MIDCVLIQWNDPQNKIYDNPNNYTVINWEFQVESLPVVGLQDDLEVFVKRTPFSIPEYDERLVLLKISQSPVNEQDAEHTTNKMWLTTYEVDERTSQEKNVSVEEAELENNLKVFPIDKHLKYLLLYCALTRREALGLSISQEQQAILEKGDAIATKMWFNHIEAIAKKSDIANNIEIDLDSNWENEEA